jgi:two-component system response regulator VicR
VPETVLIVEDERTIVEILKFNLKKEGYAVEEALDGAAGLEKARTADPDLILLDVMLPKMDGFTVCKTLRDEGNTVPILMLTAREEEGDKVLGLESGADDYITKPFSMRELLARVRANIRRRAYDAPKEEPADAPLCCGSLIIDPGSYTVTRDGKPVELTQMEYDLLRFLAATPGHVYSREELMVQVWHYESDYLGEMRTVDVTVRRLREKIEEDPSKPEHILTKRGVGYWFQ